MSANSLREAVEKALIQPTPTDLIQLTIFLRKQFADLNEQDEYTPLNKFPGMLPMLFSGTSFIAKPLHELFHKENYQDVAALFTHLQTIEKSLKEKKITILPTLRAFAAAIVGDEHVDEMLKIGFTACRERRNEIFLLKQQAYKKQLSLAAAAKNQNLDLMSQLIESGAEPQGPVEENWLDEKGVLRMRHWEMFFSATAAVIWTNNVEGLKLLLTHPKTKNKINLLKLFEQIVVHNVDFKDTSISPMEDITIDNAKTLFNTVLAQTNMDAMTASHYFCALVKNYARTVRATVYFDTPIQIKLLALYRTLTERFGYEIGKNLDLVASVKLLTSPYSLERNDTFASKGLVIRQPGFLDTLAEVTRHAEMSARYIAYHFDDSTLVTPMIQYLDDSKKPLFFAVHHANISDLLTKISPSNPVAESLNSVLYYLSASISRNRQSALKEEFQKLVAADQNGVMEQFFDELIERMKANPPLNLPNTKWQALKTGYIEALGNQNPALVAKLKQFPPSSIKCDEEDWEEIENDGVEADPNRTEVELKKF